MEPRGTGHCRGLCHRAPRPRLTHCTAPGPPHGGGARRGTGAAQGEPLGGEGDLDVRVSVNVAVHKQSKGCDRSTPLSHGLCSFLPALSAVLHLHPGHRHGLRGQVGVIHRIPYTAQPDHAKVHDDLSTGYCPSHTSTVFVSSLLILGAAVAAAVAAPRTAPPTSSRPALPPGRGESYPQEPPASCEVAGLFARMGAFPAALWHNSACSASTHLC